MRRGASEGRWDHFRRIFMFRGVSGSGTGTAYGPHTPHSFSSHYIRSSDMAFEIVSCYYGVTRENKKILACKKINVCSEIAENCSQLKLSTDIQYTCIVPIRRDDEKDKKALAPLSQPVRTRRNHG